jgi:hypothetical protein
MKNEKKAARGQKKEVLEPINEVSLTPPARKNQVIIVKKRENFVQDRQHLIDNKKNFEYINSGSVDRIIYNGKEFISVDLAHSGGRGHHMNKRFMSDIDAWLVENRDSQVFYGNNYSEQMFNLDGIEKHLGQCMAMIDINNCYWRTAYLLGYITYQTYIIGLKKDSWKIGRNACIGSLCKTETRSVYVNGVMNRSLKRTIRQPLEYQSIRNHIITHIYGLFNELFKLMGNTFCMFLTDCLVTTYDQRRFVEKYFKGHGYTCKDKPIEFLKVDRDAKRVTWLDFTANEKNERGVLIKQGVKKYYQYSNKQVIVNNMLDTSGYFRRVD